MLIAWQDSVTPVHLGEVAWAEKDGNGAAIGNAKIGGREAETPQPAK